MLNIVSFLSLHRLNRDAFMVVTNSVPQKTEQSCTENGEHRRNWKKSHKHFLAQNILWKRNRLLSVLGLGGKVLVVGEIQDWHL